MDMSTTTQIASHIDIQKDFLGLMPRSIREGRLKRVSGIILEIEGLPMSIGSAAIILSQQGGRVFNAECIGFNGSITYLMPLDAIDGISPAIVVVFPDCPIPCTRALWLLAAALLITEVIFSPIRLSVLSIFHARIQNHFSNVVIFKLGLL